MDFQDNAISIVDVSKAICTTNWQSLVDAIEIVIVGRWNVQEFLKVLSVYLVLNQLFKCLSLLVVAINYLFSISAGSL